MSEGRHYVSRFFSVLVSDVALASSRHRSRQDGGAGNPKPELDLPCAEGRPDDKKEDRISQARPTYDSIAEERPAANTLR